MENTPTLQTERLILRRFCEQDTEAILHIFSDQEVNTFLPRFPITSYEEALTLYQENFQKKYEREQAYAYAICKKSDDIPIGYVIASMSEAHDFGYALCKEYWHRGIVSEASAAVIAQLKKDGVAFITATHDVNNPRSGHVMQRLGMRYCYSYVEEHWMPKDKCVTFRMYQLNLDGNETRVYHEYWDQYRHFIESLSDSAL